MIKKLFLMIAVTFGLGTAAVAGDYVIHWPHGHVIIVVPDKRPKPKPVIKPRPKPHVDIQVWHPYYNPYYHYRPYHYRYIW